MNNQAYFFTIIFSFLTSCGGGRLGLVPINSIGCHFRLFMIHSAKGV